MVSEPAGLAAFDGDALTAYRQVPLACVLPRTKDEVSALLRFASAEGVPVIPRGAGTSLSGGALPRADAILSLVLEGYRDAEIAARGFAPADVALVRRRVDSTHWKRHLPTTAMVSNTAINEFYLRPVDY